MSTSRPSWMRSASAGRSVESSKVGPRSRRVARRIVGRSRSWATLCRSRSWRMAPSGARDSRASAVNSGRWSNGTSGDPGRSLPVDLGGQAKRPRGPREHIHVARRSHCGLSSPDYLNDPSQQRRPAEKRLDCHHRLMVGVQREPHHEGEGSPEGTGIRVTVHQQRAAPLLVVGLEGPGIREAPVEVLAQRRVLVLHRRGEVAVDVVAHDVKLAPTTDSLARTVGRPAPREDRRLAQRSLLGSQWREAVRPRT